jgi:chromate transport protein ChrA
MGSHSPWRRSSDDFWDVVSPSLLHLFVLGLVAGALSFGGAYTAIPFVQVEAVLLGAWLPQRVFIDCIAIANLLPAPLVIFATFVGFQGGLMDGAWGMAFAGAVVITLGMFLPCFIFTVAGHNVLERLVNNKVSLFSSPSISWVVLMG